MNREEINQRIKRINIRGKEYAEVSQRIMAFWELFPNGRIVTELLQDSGDRCVFKATAFDSFGNPMATGHAFEVKTSSNVNKTSYMENCETSAVGRALGILGIGSDGALASAEEVANAIEQQEAGKKGGYAKPIKSEERCQEYDLMLQAFAEYVEITKERKADAWRKFHGADVKPGDAEMALAVLHDIEAALGE